jgi:hypothetical protein
MTTSAWQQETTGVGVVDWAEFGRRYWNREPVRLRASAPVQLQQVYEMTVEAAAPFRAGLRYRVLPDVRFVIGDAQLRAPGTLLPDSADRTVNGYFDRLDAALPGEGYLLAAAQPLALDFALWAAMRASFAGLWREVGWPNLGMTTEFLIGDRFAQHSDLSCPPTHAVLTWVLHGSLDLRLWDEWMGTPPAGAADPNSDVPAAHRLRANAGDLVYWPATRRWADIGADRCVAVRVRIPVDGRLAFNAVRDLVYATMQPGRGFDALVPYFPVTDSTTMDDSDGLVDHLGVLGRRVREAATSGDLVRTLRVQWAARRSAAGLEPIPPAREGRNWCPDDLVRVSAEIVRMADDASRELWAVNGHVFALQAESAEHLYSVLPHDTAVDVAAACHAAGPGEQAERMLALLNTLYRLRGIDLVEGS